MAHPQPGPRAPQAIRTKRSVVRRPVRNDISIFYANARSIVNKIDLLHLILTDKVYDVIVLAETHLDIPIADGRGIFPTNYGRFGGGVLIAVRDPIRASPRDDILPDSELIFADILFPSNRNITIGAFYRPPSNDTKPLEHLQEVVNNLSTSELVIVGDFN